MATFRRCQVQRWLEHEQKLPPAVTHPVVCKPAVPLTIAMLLPTIHCAGHVSLRHTSSPDVMAGRGERQVGRMAKMI